MFRAFAERDLLGLSCHLATKQHWQVYVFKPTILPGYEKQGVQAFDVRVIYVPPIYERRGRRQAIKTSLC